MKQAGVCDKGKHYSYSEARRNGAHNQTTLLIDNEQRLYNQKVAFFKNYCRKKLKGKFDRNLAKKGFKNLTNEANRFSKKQYGEAIDIGDRKVAENILVRDFESTVKDEGGCKNILKW